MYGLKGNFSWTLQDLHKATTYVVKRRGEEVPRKEEENGEILAKDCRRSCD